MKINKIFIIFIGLVIIFQSSIQAAPMSFKGSITSMTTISKDYSSIESSYAITSKDSLGLRIFENKGSDYKIKSGELFHLRKLMRINAINSQTNLWLFTAAGTMSVKKGLQNKHYSYLSPTLQFDYETKRVYGLISHKVLRAGHENFDTSKIEAGFSFYETGFNETQPWFIFKVKNTNSIFNKVEYTPTLRLINKAIFMDAGLSTAGDPSIHLMYTF
ncbi:hypothetical protein PQZ09_02975 [Methylophilaceae bacterium]|nr:hypothetical protein [Methylophilaceae bacterium]